MKQNRKLSLTRGEELVKLGKALSSQVRIDILKLLEYQNLNVNEIAERLELPPSSAGESCADPGGGGTSENQP